MKKKVGFVLAIVIALLVIFYYWAGTGFYDSAKYYEVKTYHNIYDIPSDTLTIMTFNIGYLSGMTNNLAVERKADLFHKNLEKLIEFLKGYNPEIVGMQEVDFNADRSMNINQLDSVAKMLNYPNAAQAINWDKSYVPFPYWPVKYQFGKVLSGQTILSKMQIITDSVVVLQKPKSAPFYYRRFYLDRLIQISKLRVGDTDLVIMNVHLEAFDTETREEQAAKVLEVYQQYEKDYPVILMGDFNSRPPFATDIEAVEKTIAIFLQDTSLEEAIDKAAYLQNEAAYFTFDTANPYERLDYIFFSKNKIIKLESGVAQEAQQISDHLPVWMRFVIK